MKKESTFFLVFRHFVGRGERRGVCKCERKSGEKGASRKEREQGISNEKGGLLCSMNAVKSKEQVEEEKKKRV